MGRGESPAFAMLTTASRRVFAPIEKAIGDGSYAARTPASSGSCE
jgi:hypothetical protein